jgi:rRNA maturation endonuclease Nob1
MSQIFSYADSDNPSLEYAFYVVCTNCERRIYANIETKRCPICKKEGKLIIMFPADN